MCTRGVFVGMATWGKYSLSLLVSHSKQRTDSELDFTASLCRRGLLRNSIFCSMAVSL